MANVINGTSTGSGGLIQTGDDSGVLNIQTNETTAITVDASQNVGIGTTSPDALLTVNTIASFGAGAAATPSIAAKGDLNTGVFFPAADTLAASTGGTERIRMDSSGNFQFNSGYGSVATAFGCRAWVNFNGTSTVAIRASGNVSSITDNGTGDYTVNFTTAMPDANYSIVGVTGGWGSAYNYSTVNVGAGASPTTSACRIATRTAGTFNDEVAVCLSIFR